MLGGVTTRSAFGMLVPEVSMAVTATSLTLEEFLRMPEEEPALEFTEGVVSQKVSPQGKHSALQTELVRRLEEAGRPDKSARAFTELRSTYAGASRVPDIAVYRWNRIPVDARGHVADVFTTPPDIAVEIASPQQSVNGLVRRCLWYVAHGVQVALLVDPSDGLLRVHDRRSRVIRLQSTVLLGVRVCRRSAGAGRTHS